MHLSGLFVYPVKSLQGTAASSVSVDELGVVGDRRFLVVDENDRFLTQRTVPRLARIGTALTADSLVLTAAGDKTAVPLVPAQPGPQRQVSVWRSHGLEVQDCGDEVAAWLSVAVEATCRLVRMASTFRRPVLQKPRYARGVVPASPELVEGRVVTSDLFNFADGYPFMAISEASLADLNDRLQIQGEEPVPMDRFRPNLVIADCPPFAEDQWERVRIGNLVFRAAGPCSRCIVTTTDQRTGVREFEPLRTLATYRRDPTDQADVNFGQNLVHETKSGRLQVGDRLEPIAAASSAG